MADALINDVDNSEEKSSKMMALKFKMGASLKNMNVKEGMSSKMDAINRNYAKVAAACSAGLGGECFSSSCGCYFFGC